MTLENEWRLLLDPPGSGAENMRVDAQLLQEVEDAGDPLTVLRFYTWARPTISLGRNQVIEQAVDVDYCRTAGLDVVHRPTGGRAVLHGDELTYAVASNELARFGGGSVYEAYRRISAALAAGYRDLGVAAVLAPDTRRRGSVKSEWKDPCFVSPSRYELMAAGRKIVGSAQRRLRRGFLQHGSMPLTCDRGALARATHFDEPDLLESEMAGVAEYLERRPSLEAMVRAFTAAFEACFSVSLRVPAGTEAVMPGRVSTLYQADLK